LAANGDLQINPKPAGLKGNLLDWYKYCSHEKTVGLQTAHRAPDETIRYFLTDEKKATIVEGWYLDKIGRVVNIADFDAVGKGAGFNWRSQGQAGKNIISGIVIRINPSDLDFSKAKGMESIVRDSFVVQRGDTTLMAFSSFCKHFCCVPGWHESELAQSQGFWDKMFCTCHFSVYDPYQIKNDFYMLQVEEEPQEATAHA
jgi:Rieske Fe-S protein